MTFRLAACVYEARLTLLPECSHPLDLAITDKLEALAAEAPPVRKLQAFRTECWRFPTNTFPGQTRCHRSPDRRGTNWTVPFSVIHSYAHHNRSCFLIYKRSGVKFCRLIRWNRIPVIRRMKNPIN